MQMVKIMYSILIPVFASLVVFHQGSSEGKLPLSSLVPACEMHKRWIGDMQMLPSGAWLICGGKEVLLTHPLNLLGLVEIRTPGQALEFVRFFTSAQSYSLFPYVGMVEILPGEEGAYVLEEQTFTKHFRYPDVRAHPSDSEPKRFYITRTVLRPDSKVVEITEGVEPSGFYTLISQKVLIEDSSTLGLFYIGNQD